MERVTTSAPAWIAVQALDKFKQSGPSQWSARCPAHDDRNASLSVGLGDEDEILLKCHAGCAPDEIVRKLGYEVRDLFPLKGGRGYPPKNTRNRATAPRQALQKADSAVAAGVATDCNRATAHDAPTDGETERPQGCTLAQYAELKALPVAFLRERFGLTQFSYSGAPAVRIPYFAADGQEILATQFRLALDKAQDGPDTRFKWKSGSKTTAYGHWLLDAIRKHNEALLVEGVSDTQTGWYHGQPTLGIPGASIFSDEKLAPLLHDVAKIFVIIEPDKGGETVKKWAAKSKLRDRLWVIDLAAQTGHKDLSALHIAVNADHEAFTAQWEQAKAAAQRWTEIEEQQRQRETSDAWSASGALAKQQNILATFADELAAAGVAGERRNAQLLYLTVTSRFLERPISVIMKGPSSAGKSYQTERVLNFFPESAYYLLSGVSEKTLVYSEEPISHRFLVFYEAAGLSSDFATYILRSLLSEGHIRYETTEKTPEGGLKSRMIEREGPTGAIITTTAVALHPENETRMFSLAVSDTREQTAAILRAQAQERRAEVDYTRWHALQTWLESAEHRVTIPYAVALSEQIPPIAVRLRRDFTQILNLIRAHAILHQATRPRDLDGRIVATLADYVAVRELVYDLIADGVEATVPKTVRETVEAVQGESEGQAGGKGVNVITIGKTLKLDKSAAWRRVQVAIKRGYLKNLEERKGQPARIVIGEPMPEDQVILPTPEALDDHFSAVARLHTVATGNATGEIATDQHSEGGGCTVARVSEEDTTPSPPVTGHGARADVLAAAEYRGWAGFGDVASGQDSWQAFATFAPLPRIVELNQAMRTGYHIIG